MKVMD